MSTENYVLAPRTRRLQARIWDGIYCWWPGLLGCLAFMIAAETRTRTAYVEPMLAVLGICMLATLVLSLANLFQFLRTGQSWGKKRMGVLVISKTGERMSGGGLLWRCISPFVLSMVPLVGLITYFDSLFIFSDSRRCLHDHLASTQVVDADTYVEPGADGTGLNPAEIGFSRFS